QCASIAMRKDAGGFRQEFETVFADPPAHRAVLFKNLRRLGAEHLEDHIGLSGGNSSSTTHTLHRPRQVHCGGSNGADSITQRFDGTNEVFARIFSESRQCDDQSHSPSNADGRRTTHGQRQDRITDVVNSAQFAAHELVRKLALVDDVDSVSTPRPPHRFDDCHTGKLADILTTWPWAWSRSGLRWCRR